MLQELLAMLQGDAATSWVEVEDATLYFSSSLAIFLSKLCCVRSPIKIQISNAILYMHLYEAVSHV